MEYMDAGSLDRLEGAGVPEDVLARIAGAMVRGLKFLKDNLQVIHRGASQPVFSPLILPHNMRLQVLDSLLQLLFLLRPLLEELSNFNDFIVDLITYLLELPDGPGFRSQRCEFFLRETPTHAGLDVNNTTNVLSVLLSHKT